MIEQTCHRVAIINNGIIENIKSLSSNEELQLLKVEANNIYIKNFDEIFDENIEIVKVHINKNTLENDYCLFRILNNTEEILFKLIKLNYHWEVL